MFVGIWDKVFALVWQGLSWVAFSRKLLHSSTKNECITLRQRDTVSRSHPWPEEPGHQGEIWQWSLVLEGQMDTRRQSSCQAGPQRKLEKKHCDTGSSPASQGRPAENEETQKQSGGQSRVPGDEAQGVRRPECCRTQRGWWEEETKHRQERSEHLRVDYTSNQESKTCVLGNPVEVGSALEHRRSKDKREAIQDPEVPGPGLRTSPSKAGLANQNQDDTGALGS